MYSFVQLCTASSKKWERKEQVKIITIILKFSIYKCSIQNDVSDSAWDCVGLRQFQNSVDKKMLCM